MFYSGTLFKVRFTQDSGLFKFRFIQDSDLYKFRFIQDSSLFKARFIQDSGLFKARFIQDSGLFKVWFIQDSGLFRVRFWTCFSIINNHLFIVYCQVSSISAMCSMTRTSIQIINHVDNRWRCNEPMDRVIIGVTWQKGDNG